MIIYNPVIQKLDSDLFGAANLSVDVLRLDLIDPTISGNKWFKLKRNLELAQHQNYRTIITFGGAFSNHIAATAAACKMVGLSSVGVIRGEKSLPLNPTLRLAEENGMRFYFTDRNLYAQKGNKDLERKLTDIFGRYYLIPEGGSNEEGILGCMEILKPDWTYDYVLCPCGTGTTFAGILASGKAGLKAIGISVLKGDNTLATEMVKLMQSIFPQRCIKVSGNQELEKPIIEGSCITNNYCFNGYAKYSKLLVEFKNNFEAHYNIPLDHLYTAKLFYAVCDLAKKRKFTDGSRILVIHSGGLQGNEGFEKRYELS